MIRTVLNPIVMLPLLLMGLGSVSLVMVTLVTGWGSGTVPTVYQTE